MRIYYYPDVEKFIKTLSGMTQSKVLRTIELLEEFGVLLGSPHAQKIEKGIFELKIYGEQKVRIFYAIKNGEALLLHAFIKKSSRIPQRDLSLARARWKIFASI